MSSSKSGRSKVKCTIDDFKSGRYEVKCTMEDFKSSGSSIKCTIDDFKSGGSAIKCTSSGSSIKCTIDDCKPSSKQDQDIKQQTCYYKIPKVGNLKMKKNEIKTKIESLKGDGITYIENVTIIEVKGDLNLHIDGKFDEPSLTKLLKKLGGFFGSAFLTGVVGAVVGV